MVLGVAAWLMADVGQATYDRVLAAGEFGVVGGGGAVSFGSHMVLLFMVVSRALAWRHNVRRFAK
jgi:hypothetical protein